jgi:Holliday junction resolvasome RuvABC DNA-binding subunit
VRRAVLARDRQRCRVPGCTHATFLDLHHVVPRSEGGSNDLENLIGICSAHHRAAHRGELLIESGPDASPLFRHADGSAYGQAVAPRVADAQTKVFAALRHLGFRERDVRAVLAELRADDELREATVERLLREALCRIRLSR